MTVIFAGILLGLLLWLSAIDLTSLRLPDSLNAALVGTGFLWAVWSGNGVAGLLGGLFGLAVPLLIRAVYFRLRGQQGLGLGDVKFLGAAGVWVGWEGLPVLVLIACVSGLTLILGRHLTGRRAVAGNRIAFGPHLSVGLLIVWIAKVFELG